MSALLRRVAMMMPKALANVATGPGAPGTLATWDPAYTAASITLSTGNTVMQNTGAGYNSTRSTVGIISGKWSWEELVYEQTAAYLGVTNTTTGGGFISAPQAAYYQYNGYLQGATGGSVAVAALNNGDRVGIAVDTSTRLVSFYVNGALRGTVPAPTGTLYALGQGNAGPPATRMALVSSSLAYPITGFTNGLYNT